MATLCEYLQTWKLKLSTTKAVLAVYLNKKEAKRELKVNYNSEILPFCSEPAYLGLTLDRTLTTPIPRITSRQVDIAHCTLEAACWLWLGCWSNNIANSHLSPGSFNSRVLHSCQVPQCSHLPHWLCHQRRFVTCDWMPAFHTSGHSSYPRRHPTCCASSRWNHTVSSTSCHGGWISVPLSVHLSIECTAPQIGTPVCTNCTTTHQFIWQ